jgi:hypothetical protein
MKRLAHVVTVFLFTNCNPILAESYQVMGLGANSCEVFSRDYNRNPKVWEEAYFNWAQGWISGVNSLKLDNFRDKVSMNAGQQRQLIRDYCNKYPANRYLFAVLEVYKKLLAVKAARR